MFKFGVFDKVMITDENQCYVDDPKMVADHVRDHYNATCYCMSSQPSDDDVAQVLARWEDNGQNIYYVRAYEDDECKTPSCYCYCMDETGLEKLGGDIKVGDSVEVTNPDYVYSTYTEWVIENVHDIRLIATWAYNSAPTKIYHYKVLAIATHRQDIENTLAFIKAPGLSGCCYVMDIRGLRKITPPKGYWEGPSFF